MPIKPAAEAVFVGVVVWLASGGGTRATETADEPILPPGAPIQALQAQMPGLLVPGGIELDDAELAGLSPGSHPQVLTLQDAYKLACARARQNGQGKEAAGVTIRDLAGLTARLRAEENLDFAEFRKRFLASPARQDGGSFRDPGPEFLDLIESLQIIENEQAVVEELEKLHGVFTELVKGVPSGLNQKQVDQLDGLLQQARLGQKDRILKYRKALDELKLALGLAPALPIIPDRSPLAAFHDLGAAIRRWTSNPNRELAELDSMMARMPAPEDIQIGGRPLLETIRNHPDQLEAVQTSAAETATRNGAAGALDDQRALALRNAVRESLQAAELNALTRRNTVLAIRRLDDATETLLAPPSRSARRAGATVASAAAQTMNLLEAQRGLVAQENMLVQSWVINQRGRLLLYFALGQLPHQGWPSYLKSLSATTNNPPPGAPASR